MNYPPVPFAIASVTNLAHRRERVTTWRVYHFRFGHQRTIRYVYRQLRKANLDRFMARYYIDHLLHCGSMLDSDHFVEHTPHALKEVSHG